MPGSQHKTLCRDIMRFIRLVGGYAVQYHPAGGTAGTPDILACYKGRSLVVEAKRDGDKPTPLQRKRIAQWKEAGAVSFWTTDVQLVKDAISEIDKELGARKILIEHIPGTSVPIIRTVGEVK